MRDLGGNEVTATQAGAEAYDRALKQLLSFRASVGDAAQHACDTDPAAAMCVVLATYLALLSSERCDALAGGERLRAAASLRHGANERELMHFAVADQLLHGDLLGASATTQSLNRSYPRDALAVFVGHQIDFFTGASTRLESRLATVLPSWSESDDYRGYLQGMWSFGLEESGEYEKALEIGLTAVDQHSDDAWGIHAVTHVHEMRGDFERGITFLNGHAGDWHGGTFLNVHIAWHNALFMLEREDWSQALSLYDQFIRHQQSGNIALEMLDASALLWRLHLEGVDVGNRWLSLAEGWKAKQDESWYVFNDMHAVMSFVAANRRDQARQVVSRLEEYIQSPNSGTNWRMTKEVGLPICRALLHHSEGDFASAAGELSLVIDSLAVFGGSHAQRDVVHRTYIDSLSRSGRTDMARRLLEDRISNRPTSVWAQRRLSSLPKG
jgi:tetratricopeptide (TPR) repeat protein